MRWAWPRSATLTAIPPSGSERRWSCDAIRLRPGGATGPSNSRIVFAVPSRTGNANQFDLYVGDRVDIFRQTCTEAGGSGTRCAVGNPAGSSSVTFAVR